MRQNLKKLARMSDKDIDKDFLQSMKLLCEYVYTKGPEKTIETGETLTGSGENLHCMYCRMHHISTVLKYFHHLIYKPNIAVLAWSEIVQSYVDAIRNGAVPCIENAVTAMSQVENTKALNDAMQIYKDIMDAVEMPAEDQDALDDTSSDGEKRAVEYFKTHSIFDSDEHFLTELFVSSVYFIL